MLPESLDADTIRWIAIGLLVVLALIVFFVMRTAAKLVTKAILILVLAGLGGALWWQRAELSDCVSTCECRFFGLRVQVPEVAECP